MAKQTIHRTPKGRALWPKLNIPDTKFKEEGEYSVKLVLSAADSEPLMQLIDTAMKESYDETKATLEAAAKDKSDAKKAAAAAKSLKKLKPADPPYQMVADDEGNETGEVSFTFKRKASGVSRKTGKKWNAVVPLFDAAGKPVDRSKVQVWGGSTLKVAFELNPFHTDLVGAGVSLRLVGVQIIELVSGGERTASSMGFGAEEGFTYDESEFPGTDVGGDEPATADEAQDGGDF